MRKKTIGLIQKPISKYKEIIATLSRSNRRNWKVNLYQYEGFWFPLRPLEGLLLAQDHFKLQPNDVILSSLPKSGTT
ncbi:cytosolic sulfotransferase 13 [Quercus suber]|uniref:Cytosolic sulfotransferase 13 n=1 Tax=Quercus suber TaxID=58331 RepID=A0AAW0KJR1_QUESU